MDDTLGTFPGLNSALPESGPIGDERAGDTEGSDWSVDLDGLLTGVDDSELSLLSSVVASNCSVSFFVASESSVSFFVASELSVSIFPTSESLVSFFVSSESTDSFFVAVASLS